ncbi:hypothetical protein I6F65_09695 [Pseudoalteromonas sp. SWXJZ94C]|uniref:hypothetical protein n=1 Tax=Pseudoalteromonas sp. SWXJZ94C TaxID=2792065 RepID=UPI0018CD10B6|nr:hypothetical protein [Pseudoalteromonas sp. SWXJZ94C]MBH0057236.1 hypothetical protein [Pseudoalteromonas sp. SWXJZ94C]
MHYENNFLSQSEQIALQQALVNTKFLHYTSINSDNVPSPEQHAYSTIAVLLYRFNLQKIKWSSFLKTATNTATNTCQWLADELVRCQQEYKKQSNEAVIIEQNALLNGIFSEELAYIDALLETES